MKVIFQKGSIVKVNKEEYADCSINSRKRDKKKKNKNRKGR